MPVITISSQFGAGGPEVGQELARRFGIEYVDREIIHRVALGANVSEEKVEEFEEEHHSRLKSFLSTIFDFDALKRQAKVDEEALARSTYDDREKVPYHYQVDGWIDRDIYKRMIVRTISALGRRRGVVIKGRGSQCILKDNPRTLHVRFVADFEERVARVARSRGLRVEDARDLVKKSDARSSDYVRSFFQRDLADLTLYHVVLNTSRVSIEKCVEVLEDLALDIAEAAEEGTAES